MKSKLILFLLIFAGFSIQAQSYSLIPGNSVTGAVEVNGYLLLDISMLNTSSSDIFLEYELLSNTCSTNWDIVVCDYPNCYPTIPISGAMGAVARSNEGFLKLTINPLGDPGLGQLVYKVWEASSPMDIDTVTFNIDVLTKVDDKINANAVSVYPNPATDLIHIDLGQHVRPAAEFRLFSADGKMIIESPMPTNGKLDVSVESLPKGFYMIQVADRSDSYFGRVIVK